MNQPGTNTGTLNTETEAGVVAQIDPWTHHVQEDINHLYRITTNKKRGEVQGRHSKLVTLGKIGMFQT